MSISEQVAQAANPQEAMVALAEGLDHIAAVLERQSNDPWSQWDDPKTHADLNKQLSEADQAQEKRWLEGALKGVEHLLETEKDPDERRALEARRKLLKDQIRWVRPDMADGEEQRVQQTVDEETGDVVVDLPTPSPERMKQRAELADTIKLEDDFGPEIVESFIKGGPLLLYYSNREYVTGLTPDAKKAMIEDVNEFSPAEAREMGRDLLKDEDPGDPESVLGRLGQ